MERGPQGDFINCSVTSEAYKAFVPYDLPPKPMIEISALGNLLEQTTEAIGALNGVISTIPDAALINYMYVRKEAVLSSQIEGTQSTLDDLLKYESLQTQGVPLEDVAEVSSYVAALNHGIKRINEGSPLSLRLIREMHAILVANARGKTKRPGEFRTSQNWIGGTRPGNARFVPCPQEKLMDALSALEKFMHADDQIPVLIKVALIHVQFETIHPFLDGNGRMGRLLITLFLYVKGLLKSPLLYLSVYFKQHRTLYYEHLNQVRLQGDWEKWIAFFLEGVCKTADDARKTIILVQKLFADDEAKLKTLGKAKKSAQIVLEQFEKKPLLTVAEIEKQAKLSRPTIINMLRRLINMGILANISEKKWGQVYAYTAYISLLRKNM